MMTAAFDAAEVAAMLDDLATASQAVTRLMRRPGRVSAVRAATRRVTELMAALSQRMGCEQAMRELARVEQRRAA